MDGKLPRTLTKQYWPSGYRLSEADNKEIFDTAIAPQLLSGAAMHAKPILVIVGSQTGAGKASLTTNIMDLLDKRGGAAHINMDFFIPYHPYANRLRSDHPAVADAYLRPDGDRWWTAAQEYVIQKRVNALVESAMLTPTEFEDMVRKFDAAGYRVEVALMAVAPALSRLGILSRYAQELRAHGRGRLVDPRIHDLCVSGVARGAKAIDQGTPRTVQLFRRGNVRIYANRCGGKGTWYASPPAARQQVITERRRRLPPEEADEFNASHAQLTLQLDRQFREELAAIRSLAARIL